ncbi:uncharacterized protein LOC6569457 isoform X2 [Drosophila grimshawi]|uniref:uncharacterized protein LOC6569457 isoform X2 n=1 Tax=Drosophila grimshawi TaxID=7222 RepID=UPI000C87061F|nr:uncharacterized protein LOC6569457 isoform X2 [Drosophila grimshawi]
MDDLDNKCNKNASFNWDEISVGDYNLDHSQNFFVASAKEENLRAPFNCNNGPKEQIEQHQEPEQKKKQSPCQQQHQEQQLLPIIKKESVSPPTVCPGAGAASIEQNQHQFCMQELQNQVKLPLTPPKKQLEVPTNQIDNNQEEWSRGVVKSRPQLKLMWTPCAKGANGADGGGAAGLGTPRAYRFKDMYKAKREMAEQQRNEEERKAREFHSNPVPNFRAMHKRIAETIVIHRITVPVTPETVKHSKKWKEQQCIQAAKEVEDEKPMSVAQKNTKPKPFNLRTEQRMRDRREFDDNVKENHQLKKKKLDDELKQQELDERKELRKRTEFKARPNPFKPA